jgi:hypothetical protein
MISRSFTKPVLPTEGSIFTLLGGNPFGVFMFLHNTGLEQITYRFQKSVENVDLSYTDLLSPTDGTSAVSGTLDPDQVVSVMISDTSPFIRLMASGIATTELFVGVGQYSKNTSNVIATVSI